MHGASGNPMTGMHQTSRAVEEYVIEKDGKSELVNEMQFQKQMEGYIGDYPALMDRIRKGQLDYRRAKDDTQVIIKFYNDWAKMVPR